MIYSTNYYDHRCDIWSLGCMLYFMVCGYFPFYWMHVTECYREQLLQCIEIKYYDEKWNGEPILKSLCQNMIIYDYKIRYTSKKCYEELMK